MQETEFQVDQLINLNNRAWLIVGIEDLDDDKILHIFDPWHGIKSSTFTCDPGIIPLPDHNASYWRDKVTPWAKQVYERSN